MAAYFRQLKPHIETVTIKGEYVEIVQTYKYLGMQLDDKLDWTASTDVLCRKGHNWL